MIAKFEDRLIKPPLPLPPRIDPEAIKDFDYRRVYTTGRLCHEQEMLIGPRIHDGKDGFLVVTPLERENGGSTVLVNRGWIPRSKKAQVGRTGGLPVGQVTVAGLLREPWKKNMFTPDNDPDSGQFYFPDVRQMAELTGSDAVWIEETMTPDLLLAYDREARGIPIGRPAEVNLRNNHTQYIFTCKPQNPAEQKLVTRPAIYPTLRPALYRHQENATGWRVFAEISKELPLHRTKAQLLVTIVASTIYSTPSTEIRPLDNQSLTTNRGSRNQSFQSPVQLNDPPSIFKSV
ncbi:MAG: hypothetical protein Q9186_002377 [Xanthomendoza sp. 1 TL-2023]